jgi:hypothetical protein
MDIEKQQFQKRSFLTLWILGLVVIIAGLVMNLIKDGIVRGIYLSILYFFCGIILSLKAMSIGSLVMLSGGLILVVALGVVIIGAISNGKGK